MHLSKPHAAKFTFCAGALAVILIGCIEGCASTRPVKPTQPGADGVVRGPRGDVPVTIAANEIGIVFADSRQSEGSREVVRTYRLELNKEYPGGLLIYRSRESQSVQQVAHLAQEIRHKLDGLVEQAGLVVRPKGTDAPMILTDELIVQFRSGTQEAAAQALITEANTEVVLRNPFVRGQYLLRSKQSVQANALEISHRLARDPRVAFAHPNWVLVHVERQVPNDPLYANQWHHNNTGASGGTVDADIDSEQAWAITTGAANTVIAVIDSGFDSAHADLALNLWVNVAEIPGNGVDDDANGFIDDVNGWDFGDNNGVLNVERHGTSVAGCAAARGDNAIGVSGSCPNCSLMLLRIRMSPGTAMQDALAFGYAQNMGAQVITNSWGYLIGTPIPAVMTTAINNAASGGRGGLGCVIFWAMNNPSNDDCIGTTPDLSSLPDVVAVSRSTNQDAFNAGGFGDCMDILGPTHGGTLWIATTDQTGTAGYNNTNASATCPSANPAPPPADARDYTLCFNGTSAATPIVAGIAGLILTEAPALTRQQVQRLLQDTSDKTEHSLAAYDAADGFSAGAAGVATHGYGRVNGFEAVRIAATGRSGGRDGVDLFFRDNTLDWGNTEQPSNMLLESVRGFNPHWRSPDIKVDAPPFSATPVTSVEFEAFTHENPVESTTNRVYVRIRNRGPAMTASALVKLHWAFAGTALPPLPPDFWTQFPSDSTDTSIWHPMGAQTAASLGYAGASVATTADDVAQVLQFDFTAPAVDPTKPNPRHYCIMAVVDSPQDPVSAAAKATLIVDTATPIDNNITHKNLSLQDSTRSRSFEERFFVRNPFDKPIRSIVRVSLPRSWRVQMDGLRVGESFQLQAGQEQLVTIRVDAPKEGQSGEVTVVQSRVDNNTERPMGGLTFLVAPDPSK